MKPCLLLLWTMPLAAGCGESHGVPPDAAEITFDAPIPRDQGAPPDSEASSGVGEECAADADCPMGYCLDEASGFPGGYCTVGCDEGFACPDGSTCTTIGHGTSVCLRDCDPESAEPACRRGYGCATAPAIGNVCLPGCARPEDCPDGSECDPGGGASGEGACHDPGAAVGDACDSDAACPAEGMCLSEALSGWLDGSCVGPECELETGAVCPGDAVCVSLGHHGGVCFDGCLIDSDCRPGYRCLADEAFPDRRYCGAG